METHQDLCGPSASPCATDTKTFNLYRSDPKGFVACTTCGLGILLTQLAGLSPEPAGCGFSLWIPPTSVCM